MNYLNQISNNSDLQYHFDPVKQNLINKTNNSIVTIFPEPSAERLDENGRTVNFYPEFFDWIPLDHSNISRNFNYDLFENKKVDPEYGEINYPAVESFIGEFLKFFYTIPEREQIALRKFNHFRWNVFKVISQNSPATDLAISNPTLFFLTKHEIFSPFIPDTWDYNQFRSNDRNLFYLKQKELADKLFLPKSETTVKLLRKIDSKTLGPTSRIDILNLFKNPKALKLAKHMRSIDGGILAILAHKKLSVYLTSKYIQELSSEVNISYSQELHLLNDTTDMAGKLNRNILKDSFISIKQIRELHDDLIFQLGRLKESNFENGILPPPPLPGTSYIIPLTTPQAIIREGRNQENCVVTYIKKVITGDCYLYKVLRPERATLSLERNGANWEIGELKTKFNKKPSTETYLKVKLWFERILN